MKKFLFFILMLALLPIALADYCDNFNEQECTANGQSWFEIDTCNSKIICSPEYENYDELGIGSNFASCKTLQQQNFSDCENNPTSFCYNNVAYSTLESKPCGCGSGFQYRLLDSCGNPGEFADTCVQIQSCELKEITPYSGFTVTTHVNCGTTQCGNQETQEETSEDIELPLDIEIPEELKERVEQQIVKETPKETKTIPQVSENKEPVQVKTLPRTSKTDPGLIAFIVILVVLIIAACIAIYFVVSRMLFDKK